MALPELAEGVTLETVPRSPDLPVAKIDTPLVLSVLAPIWAAKTETANRLRGRIEKILNSAVASGHRPEGANPARWRGHLDNALGRDAPARDECLHCRGSSTRGAL